MALPQTLRDERAAKGRDERELSERDKRRGLALWVLACCAWSWLGIFCLAWSMHTTSQSYGEMAFWAGLGAKVSPDEVRQMRRLDDARSMPLLTKLGAEAARRQIKAEDWRA